MVRHRLVVTILTVALGGLLPACGSGDGAGDGADPAAATAVTTTPAATAEGAVEIMAGAPGAAGAAGCDATRQTVEVAVEAYLALNGEPPATQADLVDAQLLREAAPSFEIDATGTVVPAPGSPCP
jgi:hypothetical protein